MPNKPTSVISHKEFIALMALLMSLVALSIDAMLPALAEIGAEFKVADPNDNQLIISTIFIGMAIGQLIYGPLSDSIGRKLSIYIGTSVFAVGCVLSLFADSFNIMLLGRILQGLGIAGPRIVSVALIRDQFEGRKMAQVMSFTMALFILCPVIAPAIGQGIIAVANWRAIFVFFLLLSIIAVVWLAIRQPETLLPEKRAPLSLTRVLKAMLTVCTTRVSFGYTLAAGFISGLFLAFLGTSQQVLQMQYQLGELFPLYFAFLALAIGLASYVNGRLVIKHGMQFLSSRALYFLLGCSILFLAPTFYTNGHPPFWSFMCYMLLCFFCIGLLFGNLTALAMEPLGHIAGVGAAVIGSLSTIISLPIGIYIGQIYDGTVLPLILGFTFCSFVSILVVIWTGRETIKTIS